MRPEEQLFLWQDRLPVGHISVIAGAPSMGKSTLGYRIATDADVPTIFVTTEESDKTVWRPRVEAAGADLDKVWHHPEIKFTRNPDDLDSLRELIRLYEAQLVIVDPITNHLRASIHRNDQVRDVFEPYLAMLQEEGVALLLQMHVLRQTSVKKHPRLAVPAGVESVAKAIYLFGDDPQFGADPNMRILANAQKFNFGAEPASLQFEYSTAPVSVRNPRTRKRRLRDFGFWIDRGETQVTAKMLLVKLAPDKKESKSDRVVMELVELLREGPMSTRDLKEHFLGLMPPITWRTVERVKRDMEIEEADDPADGRSKLWSLYGLTLEDVEDADSLDDLVVEEIDAPDIPDVIPEDWMDEEGAA